MCWLSRGDLLENSCQKRAKCCHITVPLALVTVSTVSSQQLLKDLVLAAPLLGRQRLDFLKERTPARASGYTSTGHIGNARKHLQVLRRGEPLLQVRVVRQLHSHQLPQLGRMPPELRLPQQQISGQRSNPQLRGGLTRFSAPTWSAKRSVSADCSRSCSCSATSHWA